MSVNKFNGAIQVAVNTLVEDCSALESAIMVGNDMLTGLMQLEKKCLDLCTLFKEFMGCQSDLLMARVELQTQLSAVHMSDEAKQIWMVDQLAFYKVWVTDLQAQLTGRKDICTLKISSKELLLIARLLRDMDLFEQCSLKQMLGFICASFCTVNQQRLSYESMRKKYSDVDQGSILKVKKLLLDMSNRLSDY